MVLTRAAVLLARAAAPPLSSAGCDHTAPDTGYTGHWDNDQFLPPPLPGVDTRYCVTPRDTASLCVDNRYHLYLHSLIIGGG